MTDTAPPPDEVESFDFGAKKKKKKTPKVEDVEEVTEKVEKLTVENDEEEDPAAMFADLKKKKKKKVVLLEPEATPEDEKQESPMEDGVDEEQDEVNDDADPEEAWLGTDRDYTYPELLSRVFRLIRVNNPELFGEKRRYTIPPPIVQREGTKKTLFANIVDICNRMHRTPEHVIQFLFAELGTTGSVAGAGQLIIKGRFSQKHMENVLKRYIVEYVTCKVCRSPNTQLTRGENRLYFVECENCHSRRAVSAIKAGFQAQVGKRPKG